MAEQKVARYGTPYQYTAQEIDRESQLYYYGARYYNPRISQFLSVDPLAEERSWLTPYNYVQNNPLNRIDPTGMLDTLPQAFGPTATISE